MTTKVLIIEDDHVINDMYTLKLRKEGLEVEQAFDGLEGLTKMPIFDPDVILLDLMMPSMNGFETLATIKAQSSSICKIIIFTNIVDKDKIKEAMELGADDYLIKADTTPADALKKVNFILSEPKENIVHYIEHGLNHFKLKNPNGGDDIDVDINIKI